MVHCPACTVEHIDRHCTNTPRLCHQCCTAGAAVLTCPPHFHAMGNSDREARLTTRLVHASLLDDVDDLPPPNGGPAPDTGSLSPASQPPALNPAPPAQPPLQPAPPVAQAADPIAALMATLTSLTASMTAMRAEFAQLQLQVQQRQAAQPAPAPAPGPAPAPAPSSPLPAGYDVPVQPATPPHGPLPFIPMRPLSSEPPPLVQPPHRSALLGQSAAARADVSRMVNNFAALAAHDDSDAEDHQVPSPHTDTARRAPTVALPAAFVPTAVGSEENATQRLTAIVNSLAKKSGKSHLANINELNEELDDWATSWLKAGTYTAAQIESVRAYQRLLVQRLFMSERRSFTEVLEYHRKWCKAVHAGTIDMFAPGAELNLAILHEVYHPLNFAPQGSSSSPSHRGGKSKTTVASPKSTPRSSPPTAKYPAGSCSNHPESTTHTTEQCKVGIGKRQ